MQKKCLTNNAEELQKSEKKDRKTENYERKAESAFLIKDIFEK